jgi:hypothetical protein
MTMFSSLNVQAAHANRVPHAKCSSTGKNGQLKVSGLPTA